MTVLTVISEEQSTGQTCNSRGNTLVKLHGLYSVLGWETIFFGIVCTERIRAPISSSGVSVQQSVGSSLGRDPCVLKQDTLRGTLPWSGRVGL